MRVKRHKSGLWVPDKTLNLVGPAFFGGAAAAATDPDFANVVLLLHCDGTDEGTTFIDSSSLAQTMAVINVVTNVGSQKFGTAGARFDTNAGNGNIRTSGSPAATYKFLHDGSNWTYEGWAARPSRTGEQGIFGNGVSTGAIGIFVYFANSSRAIGVAVTYGSVGNYVVNGVSGANAWPDDSNYHFLRITCDFGAGSNQYKVYVDDMTTPVAQFSKTANPPSSSNPTSSVMYLGAYGSGGGPSANGTGWDEIRITKNVIRTGAAPTAAFPDS